MPALQLQTRFLSCGYCARSAQVAAQGETALPRALKDAYVIRFCLYDYSDGDAIKILQTITPAMKNDARFIVMDAVVPGPNKIGHSEEKLQRLLGLQMMAFSMSVKEREIDD